VLQACGEFARGKKPEFCKSGMRNRQAPAPPPTRQPAEKFIPFAATQAGAPRLTLHDARGKVRGHQ